MKKNKVTNIKLLFGILFIVSFISVSYAALNTNMLIDGNAVVQANLGIRITNIKLLNATNGAYETYNSKYSKDSITNGIVLPNDDSTISYNVTIRNKDNQKYVIKDIFAENSNNENVSFETNYSKNEVIDESSTKEIEVTYKTSLGSENKNSVILKFEFLKAFNIYFDANNGKVDITNKLVLENDKYGDLPIPTRSGYSFLGWYTKKEGGEKIENSTKVTTTNDQILYARWELSSEIAYLYDGDYEFDGTNYIDTGVKLFSQENIEKDFEISFEIKERISTNSFATMMSIMDETGSPWPGMVYRVKDSNNDQFGVNASSFLKSEKNYPKIDIKKVSIKRTNNIVYISFNDGYDTKVIDISSLIQTPFDIPLTFGASLDGDLNPFRYFSGTLSNMKVIISENKKVITYDANNDSNLTYKQIVIGKKSVNLIKNSFTKTDYGFTSWNTKADGTGTSYKDGDIISSASTEENITLYAQWGEASYIVRFDANGGTGKMEDQIFETGNGQKLLSNSFTRNGSKFLMWNTRSDGLGKSYLDGEYVKNLGSTEGEIVTLYALWGNSLQYSGNNIFDGTNYIDTGIKLFSEENISKNFEISFEINNIVFTEQYQTIMSAMNEKGSPWPGIVYRLKDENNYQLIVNATNSTKKETNFSITGINKITIKRVNNLIYINKNDGENTKILDTSSMLGNPFDVPLTFGASLDGNLNPFRYFQGTISNIKIYVYD